MNDQNKSKEELIVELQKLKQDYDSLKDSFETNMADRKKAELEIKESKEHYRLLTENIKDVVWILDAETLYFRYVSPSVERLRGFTPEEILAKPMTEALTPEGAAYITQLIHSNVQAIRSGQKIQEFFIDEVEQPCKDGSMVFTEVITSYYVNPENGRVEVRGVTRDITKRKQAEKEKLESEEKLKYIIQDLPVGVLLQGPHSEILLSNPKAMELLGFTEDQILGKTSFDPDWNIIREDGTPFSIESRPVPKAIATCQPVLNVTMGVYRPALKNRIWLLANAIPYLNEDGTVKSIVSSFIDITNRIETEDALRVYKAKLEAALNSMTDAVFISNAAGEFIEFNDAFATFHRFRSKTECARKLSDYPEILEVYNAEGELAELDMWAVPRALRGESVINEEYSLRRKDTGETWVGSYSFSPIRDKDGLIVGSVVVGRDVTVQKQIEKAQKEADAKFGAVFHVSPIAFAIYDMDGTIIEANPAYAKLTGYSHKELVGKTTIELNLISPEDRQRMLETIAQSNGSLENFDMDLMRRDGSKCALLVSSKIISIHGKPRRLGINVDINSRKQAENALRQSEENFSKAFMASPAALLITRLSDGQFMEFNDAYCTIVGYKRHELLGRRTTDFNIYIHSSDRQTIVDQLKAMKSVRDFETSILHRSGTIRHVVANQDFVTFNDEKCILTSLLDITNRKLAEEALFENQLQLKAQNEEYLAINEELKEKNQEYAALNEEYITQNEELIEAKEKAEQSDRLKTAFLQNMSHEIRTPMNAIMGFSELLVEQYNNKPKLEQFSQIINQRCADLLGIINEILDVARIESGQLPVHIEECRLNSLFSEISSFFNEYQKRQNKQHITFNIHLDGASETVINTDKVKLKQILINLIGNAFKFTNQGEIVAGCKPHHDQHLLFFVSDTGIGIPDDKQDFIFERFAQLEQTPGVLYGGTGLGLSIVKGLVDLLGGKIWLESELNKGTTFYFTFPYEKADISGLKHVNTESAKQYNFSNRVMLIVEDDKYNADYLKEVLEETGIQIIHTFYGTEAVRIAQSKRLDIVLMDIRLPDMDGYKATQIIKKYNPELKIIAQTAYAAEEDREKSLLAGCTDYVSKPVKRDLLLNLLHKHLS